MQRRITHSTDKILDNITTEEKNTEDGGVTDPQRLSAGASGREGGSGERLELSKKVSPLKENILFCQVRRVRTGSH